MNLIELAKPVLLRPEHRVLLRRLLVPGAHKPFETLTEVRDPVELAKFAIVDDIDAHLALLLYNSGHAFSNRILQVRVIDCLAQAAANMPIDDPLATDQTADVSRQGSRVTALH